MDALTKLSKIEEFANLLEKEQLERLHTQGINYAGHEQSVKVSIKEGNKYFKIDVGTSGKYMIDSEGNIFGIKAYGVIHRGHQYGTLETINDWYWGEYTATKKA